MIQPGDRIVIGGEVHTVTKVEHTVLHYRVPFLHRVRDVLDGLRWHIWDWWHYLRWIARRP